VVADLPVIEPDFAQPNPDGSAFLPYARDPQTLARPWAPPGVAGLEHRIGGIEKADGTGNINYEAANHEYMIRIRQAKVDRIAESIPLLEVDDASDQAKVLVIGWGSTYGPIGAAVRRVRNAGHDVAEVHLRHLNPFPKNLGDILRKYHRVLVPEMNLGQLALLLRAKYLVDAVTVSQVNGMPFKAAALAEVISSHVVEVEGTAANLAATPSPKDEK
jgi:2-oxoglutarate ferredoxin oxidoreductase subunit alpha